LCEGTPQVVSLDWCYSTHNSEQDTVKLTTPHCYNALVLQCGDATATALDGMTFFTSSCIANIS